MPTDAALALNQYAKISSRGRILLGMDASFSLFASAVVVVKLQHQNLVVQTEWMTPPTELYPQSMIDIVESRSLFVCFFVAQEVLCFTQCLNQ
jgi:hypothetical protein